jgi:hypothetical protein
MLPVNRHVDLADTSLVPRSLLSTITSHAARMKAGWRPAQWRSLNVATVIRNFEAFLPSVCPTLIHGNATAGGGLGGGGYVRGGEGLSSLPGDFCRWTIPLNVGDRLLRTRVRFGSDTVFRVIVERVTAPSPTADGTLEVIADRSFEPPPLRVTGRPVARDAAINLFELGLARPSAEWEFYRIGAYFNVDAALAAATLPTVTFVSTISVLVDHPVP